MGRTPTGWSPFLAKPNPKIRPGAGGHRFGPDLQCTECGRYWDAHQQTPRPCSHSLRAVDAFTGTGKLAAGKQLAREAGEKDRKQKLELP